MTAEEIAKLRELCARATPGHWRVDWTWTGKHSMPMCVESSNGKIVTIMDEHEPADVANAEWMAAAREALPRALDEIERLRAELAKPKAVP